MQKKLSPSVRINYFNKEAVEKALNEYIKGLRERHPLPSHFPVGVDIFPYTEKEIEKMKAEGNFFIRKALEEGKEIL